MKGRNDRFSKGFFTLNIDDQEVMVSESLVKILGITSNQKTFSLSDIGALDIRFSHKERWVCASVGLKVLRKIKKELHLDFMMKSKRSSKRLFQLTTSPLPFGEEQVSQVIAILSDMDKVLEDSEQLKITNRRLKKVQEVGGLGYFVIDFKEEFWEVSSVLGNLLEFDEHRNNNLYSWKEFIHLDHRNEFLALFEQCLKERTPFQTKCKALRQKSDDYIWLEVHGEFEYLPNGEPKWMLGTAKDISEFYQTLENLEITNRVLEESQSVAQLGTFTIDFQRDCYHLSKVLQEMLELDKDEHSPVNSWGSFIHPEDMERANESFVSTISNQDKSHQTIYRILTDKRRSLKWLEIKGEVFYTKEGTPVEMIGTVLDITDRVQSMERLEKQNAILRDIAWDQSHLVRGPISRIQALMIELEDEMSESDREHLINEVKNSVYELDDIVRSVVQKTNNLSPIGMVLHNQPMSNEKERFTSTLIHVVDDDPIVRALHTKLVHKINMGLKVVTSKNGKEFIDSLNIHKDVMHLVLLDINMPDFDGWDVLKYLRNQFSPMPMRIYMVSSSTSNRDQQRALQNSLVSDYITKPLRLETLRRVLKDFE